MLSQYVPHGLGNNYATREFIKSNNGNITGVNL